jgi:hypothetical protein
MKQGEFLTGPDNHVSRRRAWKQTILEKAIVKVIRDGLVACRIPHWLILARVPCPKCKTWGAEPADRGIPDIAGIVPPNLFLDQTPVWGRPLFIEVKRPQGGVESIEQQSFIEERRKAGAIAFFARGWDDVAENLTQAGVHIFPKDLRFIKQTEVSSNGKVESKKGLSQPGPGDHA